MLHAGDDHGGAAVNHHREHRDASVLSVISVVKTASYGSEEISFRYSASLNAREVRERMFPAEPSVRASFAAASSLGKSATTTMSYSPMTR